MELFHLYTSMNDIRIRPCHFSQSSNPAVSAQLILLERLTSQVLYNTWWKSANGWQSYLSSGNITNEVFLFEEPSSNNHSSIYFLLAERKSVPNFLWQHQNKETACSNCKEVWVRLHQCTSGIIPFTSMESLQIYTRAGEARIWTFIS